jgi:putative tryptophan/tyrosine transport system substrate-binding protein
MQRRKFVFGWPLLAWSAAALAPAAWAQPRAVPRIGVLLYTAMPPSGQPHALLEAFRQGLRDLGYVEGQTLQLELRWADSSDQRASELAKELVGLNVAVIVSAGGPATLAAMRASTSVPVVMAAVGDPVGSGIVASLARPGGNVTGLSLFDSALDGKRIDLLKAAVPGISRIAMLWSPNDPGMALAFSRVERASQELRLELQSLTVRGPGELDGAAQAAGAGRAQAVLVTAQPFTIRHQAQILETVQRLKLPAMYTDRRFVDAGGLMSYGPNLPDMYYRAASYVDRILKGAKPADLPVQQPTKFELVINLGAARALGLTIAESLLLRADEVIR